MPDAPILVVDDDESIRTTVSDVLDLEGFRVVTAANGAEALERVAQSQPAVVLLDMRMPVMDGWAFAHEVAVRGIRVPILVMTAADNARAWAEEIGADGYVAKPFDLNELISAVHHMVEDGPAA